MADETLPTDFDAIVLGTGLTESIVAAALSRIGKKVLHIDRNQYYGSQWATFAFEEIVEWAKLYQEDKCGDGSTANGSTEEGIDTLPVPEKDHSISNIVIKSFLRAETEIDAGASPADKTKDVATTSHVDNAIADNLQQGGTESSDHPVVEAAKHEDRAINMKEETAAQSVDASTEAPISQESTVDKDVQGTSEIAQVETDGSTNTVEKDSKLNDMGSESAGVNAIKSYRTESSGRDDNGSNAGPVDEPVTDGEGDNNRVESSDSGADIPQATEELTPATRRLIAQSKIASHSQDISMSDLNCLSRKFNLDLAPKLMFARGPLIELLINANITHYSEFRTAERILTYKDDKIAPVPCSRADVFSSDAVNVMEKRVLMKFLSFCVTFDENPQEYEEFIGRPFIEFLVHKRLSKNLQHFVLHAIAMVKETVDTPSGLREAQRFLRSLGRYSNSPFVWTLYGIGEMPQAYCRMSAVFGGTYCLRRSAKSLSVSAEENRLTGIVCTENQEIAGKYLIMERSYLPVKYMTETDKFVSRAILIIDKSLKEAQDEHVTLLTIPPREGFGNDVRVIEIGPASMACPMGLFVVHLTTTGVETPERDLQPVVDLLFDTDRDEESTKPRLLWIMYFSQVGRCDLQHAELPSNVFVTNPPGESLGFEDAVIEIFGRGFLQNITHIDGKEWPIKARAIFDKICPDSEFLPPVPNPEDIIWDDTNKQLKPAGGFLQTDEDDAAGQEPDADVQDIDSAVKEDDATARDIDGTAKEDINTVQEESDVRQEDEPMEVEPIQSGGNTEQDVDDRQSEHGTNGKEAN